MKKNKSIKHVGASSAGVLISRVFGLIRDVFQAHFLTTAQMDIFAASFKVPNVFRSIVAEGAANNSFVPVISQIEDENERREFVNSFFTLFIIFSAVFVMVLIALTPLLLPIYVKGFSTHSPESVTYSTQITQFFMIYLFLISLTSFFSSILTSMYKFFAPAFHQVFFNISFVVVLIIAALTKTLNIYTTIYCVLIGGLAQLIYIIINLYKAGVSFKVNFNFKNKYIKKVLRLFLPSVLSSSAYQINVFISGFFLCFFVGANQNIYYAQRIYQLPVGIFAVAMSQVFLTDFSHNAKNKEGLASKFNSSLLMSLLISLPFLGYMIGAGNELIKTLFFHGNFTLESAKSTFMMLLCYAPGLVFISSNRLFVSYYYSKHEAKIPVIISFVTVAVYYVAVRISILVIGQYGIALANSISLLVQTIIYVVLTKRNIKLTIDLKFLFKMVLVTFVTTILTYGLQTLYVWKDPISINWISLKNIIFTGALSLFYFSSFLVLSRVFKISEVDNIANNVYNVVIQFFKKGKK